MAKGEVTGATKSELRSIRGQYYQQPNYRDHGIPFEVAYCLTPIGKQPDEYDGKQRYCKNRAAKKEDYDGDPHDEEAYWSSCRFHGKSVSDVDCSENLLEPGLAYLKHGVYAEDEHLQMDFTDEEQRLYDSIMEWAEVYGWPDRSEDPARYLLLERVATNVVRTERAEEYLDDEGEVRMAEIYDEHGQIVGEEPRENPIGRETRLLQNLLIDLMKELGITPKQQSKMDKVDAEADAASAIGEMTRNALDSDREYDPDQFDDGEGE